MRKFQGYIAFATFAIVLLVADLVTKHFAAIHLGGQVMSFIPHILGLTYHRNSGMAFGWFQDGRPWLIAISIIMILGAAVFYWWHTKKPRHMLFHVAMGFFFAGAVGNLVDRIFLGYVRDFLFFEFWANSFIFNLADAWLNIAVVLILVYVLFFEGRKNGNCGSGGRRWWPFGRVSKETDGGTMDAQPDNERD